MRLLTMIAGVLALLYGGYWLVASRSVEAAVRAEVERLSAAGLGSAAEVRLEGFPSRFDLTFEAPEVLDRSGLTGWRAPFLQVFALAYRPNHVIVVWPNEQEVMLAGLPFAVTSADMRASAVVAGTDIALDHMTYVAKDLRLSPPDGAGIGLGEARLATRRAPALDNGHDLGVALLGLTPDPALRATLDPGGTLPDSLDWLRLDAGLAFDRPIDRFAGAGDGPRVTAVDLREVSLRWGSLSLEGKGRVAADSAGLAEGRIDLVARDWRRLVALAAQAGMVKPELAPTFEAMLDQIDAADGDPDALRAPLVWKDGRTRLGPIPLGPAPRF